jgi:hypothetical protein
MAEPRRLNREETKTEPFPEIVVTVDSNPNWLKRLRAAVSDPKVLVSVAVAALVRIIVR